MTAYATEADYVSVAGAVASGDLARQLDEASDLLDSIVTAPFVVDAETGLPADADVAAVMRRACCHQVRFWAEVGEENDIDGLAGTPVSIAGYSGTRPPDVAPRAKRVLKMAGLL